MEELDQAARELFPVDDELPQAPGMKHDMHGVSRARIIHLVGLVEGTEQPPGGVVSHPDVPSSVDHDPGIGFLLAENELQRPLDMLQVQGVEVALAEGRGIACGQVQGVLLVERQVQRVSQQLDHVPARLRAPGLEEAKMPRRYRCFGCKLELAQPANLPPMTQQAAKVARRRIVADESFRRIHGTQTRLHPTWINYLGCKCRGVYPGPAGTAKKPSWAPRIAGRPASCASPAPANRR